MKDPFRPRGRNWWTLYAAARNGLAVAAIALILIGGWRPSPPLLAVALVIMIADQFTLLWLNDARLIWRGIARMHEDVNGSVTPGAQLAAALLIGPAARLEAALESGDAAAEQQARAEIRAAAEQLKNALTCDDWGVNDPFTPGSP